jgi:2OG-Fe(II) oxygenase superfamily
MKQEIVIPGLSFYPGFVSPVECAALQTELALQLPQYEKHRTPDYFAGWFSIFDASELGPVARSIAERIQALGVLSFPTNTIQVNHYPPGVGIRDHIDALEAEEGAVLTLGEASIIHFREEYDSPIRQRLLLEPGDVYVMAGESANFVHGITNGPQRLGDRVLTRTRERMAMLFSHWSQNV